MISIGNVKIMAKIENENISMIWHHQYLAKINIGNESGES
jgi:hypothetical protein